MKCKYCSCEEMDYRSKPPHLGAYCKNCGKFQCWVKQGDNPKTREEYRDEYLDKQPATTQQIRFIQVLCRDLGQTGISKLQACKVIDILKPVSKEEQSCT